MTREITPEEARELIEAATEYVRLADPLCTKDQYEAFRRLKAAVEAVNAAARARRKA